jgi:hypothetical protein
MEIKLKQGLTKQKAHRLRSEGREKKTSDRMNLRPRPFKVT